MSDAVSLAQVHAFRLRGHHLDRPAPRSQLVTVVRDTCGVQAQIPTAAELALRARVRGLRRDDMRSALERERTLVRGWFVRFAVHVIPAEDFLLYTRALSARADRSLRWMRRRGRDVRELERIVAAISRATSDGPLTRHALADRVASELGERKRKSLEHPWGGLVVEACLRGLVCFGPEQGNEVTFVSRGAWLSDVRDPSVEEAGPILLRRYLRAFGPAAPRDFQRWAEIPMPIVKGIWSRAEPDLVGVRIEGRDAWVTRADWRVLRKEVPPDGSVRLLPSFDPYLLGHREKGHLVDAAHYKRVYRKAGWLSPVVLVDGCVAGVWSHRQRRSTVRVTVEAFRRLDRAEREGIASEAEDVGRFLGGDGEVGYGAVKT